MKSYMDNVNTYNRDLKWAAQIRSGNISAFNNLFETYYIPLCQHAINNLNDPSLTEDAVQDVFRWIWEERHRWEPTVSVRAYLWRAVSNRTIIYIRKKRFEVTVADMADTPDIYQNEVVRIDDIQNKELGRSIREAIGNLPEKQREIIELNLFHGYSYREIAERMNISVNTVNTQMYRARKCLCDRLKKHTYN